ncbi:MAG TPA: hypothetical protein EYM95_03030 [Candidatus Obscuribacterales bacterium]|nr:hypothetical protein [Candidatus Obscuribacterales bacterium]
MDCVIHGRVSGALLRNLTEFQSVWTSWFPNLYKMVDLIVDRVDGDETEAGAEVSGQGSNRLDAAIAAYTGGIDSSYTVMRHHRKQCGRMSQPLSACLFVHGFDIPLSDEDAFNRVVERLGKTLSGTHLELISMASNHKELNPQ